MVPLYYDMCFSREYSFRLYVTDTKNPVNLKVLTVNLVPGLFKQGSRFQIFLFVEQNSMDSS